MKGLNILLQYRHAGSREHLAINGGGSVPFTIVWAREEVARNKHKATRRGAESTNPNYSVFHLHIPTETLLDWWISQYATWVIKN